MSKEYAQAPRGQTMIFDGEIGGKPLRVVSQPGFPGWDAVTPAQRLLGEGVILRRGGRVLHLGCGHGALGVALARQLPEGSVDLVDASAVAVAVAEQTLAANEIANARALPDPATLDGEYDAAVVLIPAGRAFARRWLAQAHAALKPGGHLYLAGPKDEGIESLVRDAKELCGQGATLAYREHNRAGVATKLADHAPPAWAIAPGTAPGTWHRFTVATAGRDFAIDSLPGIFSYDRLDEGTALLLDALAAGGAVPPGGRALDLGCGYGILGLALAAQGAGSVDLVDLSLPAVAATARNIAAAGLANARALAGDGFAAVPGARYDLIVTNPPFHTGKAVDYDSARRFMRESAAALTPKGSLLLVANAFLPYEAVLRERFRRVEQVAATPRFQVLRAADPGDERPAPSDDRHGKHRHSSERRPRRQSDTLTTDY